MCFRSSQKEGLACHHCHLVFRHPAVLESHLNLRSTATPFSCQDCGESFKLSVLLQLHSNKHRNQPKMKKCRHCEFSCSNIYEFTSHLRSHAVICPECQRKFKSESALARHLLMHEEPLLCEQCGFATPVRSILASHLKCHQQEAWTCSFCGRSFMLKSKLAAHVSSHVLLPFKCEQCLATYRTRSGLSYHQKYFHGNGQVVCEVCGKTYKSKTHLKKHRKMKHSQGKP